MKLFGLEITKASVQKRIGALSAVSERGWWPLSMPGDFQRDIHVSHDRVLSNWTVFACMTLIAGDVGKLRLKLVEQDDQGIWTEVQSPAFSPVIRKPNAYQTRQQFIERWVFSKLEHGNTYVLKERDNRGVVTALYVLNPCRVKPLVAPDGSIYYELNEDYLSQVPSAQVVVPASEIIHDRMNCLFHPLIGISPLFASGLAASQGLRIQENSATFFGNMSRPGGILTAPGEIKDEYARSLKDKWESNYGAGQAGKVAVLANGLTYQAMSSTAHDSQLVEQLNLTALMICSTFHVPAWKVGVGSAPPHQSAETEELIYYKTGVQAHLEAIEALLDEGLGLVDVPGRMYGSEFDTDGLLRMDVASQMQTLKLAIDGSIMAPDEARHKLNLPPVPGGASPMAQQQNYSLAALAKRDAAADPFGTTAPVAAPVADQTDKALHLLFRKSPEALAHA